LTKCGAVNYVVAPRLLENQRSKRQKTDRLDARALLGNLESYLRGNRDAMSIIAVPSPLQEQQRSVVRYLDYAPVSITAMVGDAKVALTDAGTP
jgi:transposase